MRALAVVLLGACWTSTAPGTTAYPAVPPRARPTATPLEPPSPRDIGQLQDALRSGALRLRHLIDGAVVVDDFGIVMAACDAAAISLADRFEEAITNWRDADLECTATDQAPAEAAATPDLDVTCTQRGAAVVTMLELRWRRGERWRLLSVVAYQNGTWPSPAGRVREMVSAAARRSCR